MTDLSDLHALGNDARTTLTAFTVALEALSDPHYQFKRHVGNLRAAIFLLDSAQSDLHHEVAKERRALEPRPGTIVRMEPCERPPELQP